MSKMRTPAMEKIEKKNAKRKKPVKSTPMRESMEVSRTPDKYRRFRQAFYGIS